MPAQPFTALDLQLVLLRRMADHQPDLVENARHELGVPAAGMREANRRWQAMVRSSRARGAASRYRSALGAPESRTRRRIGDLECEALLWPLPLWPALRFEILLGPDGVVWNEWLVRAPGEPAPVLRSVGDLRPWSCTVDEVARAFAPARPLEGTAPTRWRLVFTAPSAEADEPDTADGAAAGSGGTDVGGTRDTISGSGADGRADTDDADDVDEGADSYGADGRASGGRTVRRRCVAEFTWGLLQRVGVDV